MSGIQLREATRQDREGMIALVASLPEWFTPDELETVREVIGPPGVVAVDEADTIVGLLVWEQRADEWEICWIAVARDRHRQGLGRRMLVWMLERAKGADVEGIRVQTVADTTHYKPYFPTRAFYAASGFKLVSVEPNGWPDGMDKAIYARDLRPRKEGR
jgi:ribosomal protein S18 acetylase RimI-like enzyme